MTALVMDKVTEILNHLHFMGTVGTHASDDNHVKEAAHQINQLIVEAYKKGLSEGKAKYIQELRLKNMKAQGGAVDC